MLHAIVLPDRIRPTARTSISHIMPAGKSSRASRIQEVHLHKAPSTLITIEIPTKKRPSTIPMPLESEKAKAKKVFRIDARWRLFSWPRRQAILQR